MVLNGQQYLSAKLSEKELVIEFEKTIVTYKANENSNFQGAEHPFGFIPRGSIYLEINIKYLAGFTSFELTTEYGRGTISSGGVYLRSTDPTNKCNYEAKYEPNLPYIAEQERILAQKTIKEEKINQLKNLLAINRQERDRLISEINEINAEN